MKAKFIKPTPTEEGITLTFKIANSDLTKAMEHEMVDMRGEIVEIKLADDNSEPTERKPLSVLIDGQVYVPFTELGTEPEQSLIG